MDSAMTLLRVMDRVPAMLVPLMPGRVEGKNASDQAVMWGSIVQAVWSFCLALRERGLGSALDDGHTGAREGDGRPPRHPVRAIYSGGLVSHRLYIGTDFKRAWRNPSLKC